MLLKYMSVLKQQDKKSLVTIYVINEFVAGLSSPLKVLLSGLQQKGELPLLKLRTYNLPLPVT